jgi:hypothetical protein
MKPPLPHSESAVPRTLHAQLEIAKAMRTLMAPDEAELLRRRRAEIAAIRRDLEALARQIPRAFKEASALVKRSCAGHRGNTTPISRGCRAAVEPRKQLSMTQSIQVGRLERQTAKEVDSGPRMAKQMPLMKMQKRAYSMRRWKFHLRARVQRRWAGVAVRQTAPRKTHKF